MTSVIEACFFQHRGGLLYGVRWGGHILCLRGCAAYCSGDPPIPLVHAAAHDYYDVVTATLASTLDS